MRKTILILLTVFINAVLGALTFFAAGSVILGGLISVSAPIVTIILSLLAISFVICLVNLLFYKLLRLSLLRFALIALPSLLAGIVLYFIFYAIGV